MNGPQMRMNNSTLKCIVQNKKLFPPENCLVLKKNYKQLWHNLY